VEPLRVFGKSQEAARAFGWLRRSGLTPELRGLDDGRVALEIPAEQRERAESVLQAVAGMRDLDGLPPTPRRERILTWENVGALFAVLVFAGLGVVAWVGLGGLMRYVGVAGAVSICVAGLAYVAYSGFSAANVAPERVSMSHGVITQDEAVTVSYRRAFVRQTWPLVGRRHRGDARPRTAGGVGASSPTAPSPERRAPFIHSGLVRCHRCERLVDLRADRCSFCGARRRAGSEPPHPDAGG